MTVPQRESTLPRSLDVPANTDNTSPVDETEWLYAAANNPVFQYLHDPTEDIYTIADGEPIRADEV